MNIKPGPNFLKFGDLDVTVQGSGSIAACNTFRELHLKQPIRHLLSKNDYKQLTPIQSNVIPAIQAERDVLACSPTGTGKTAAYWVPIIDKLLKDWRDPIITVDDDDTEITCYPQVLVVTPTRELAIQTLNMCKELIKNTLIVALPAYGGVSTKDQIADLTGRGAHILVATPGRLKDFLRRKYIDFSEIRFLVLDEADKMLAMGFRKDVLMMVNHQTMKEKGSRQTLMFSATYPDDVQKLALKIMKDHLFIVVGQVNAPSKDVDEHFIEVHGNKADKLLELLREEENENELTLIFVNRITSAHSVAQFLQSNGFDVCSMASDIRQRRREAIVREFDAKVFNILVATDVMARGINIKDLKHVINYDLPCRIPEYVNRIGRAGRLGNLGKATSLFEPGRREDENIGPHLVYCLGYTQKEVPQFLLKYLKGDLAIKAAGRNFSRR